MKIFLRGGPRDGESVPAHTDDYGVPLERVQFPQPVSDASPMFDNGLDAYDLEQGILVYTLEKIVIDGKLHHYEYHYQGR
ncbi:TPA: hypothetical protein ACGQTX_002981 [Raoultella ornithinolytica]|uniref:hypothetical protein n=1 Tax=Raoultella ornithinolytica TaxID=54291 RepID=UPI0033119C23|nr:hypothetical protein [Raoultella ornithinolytica]